MKIYTSGGVEYSGLPDNAKCKTTGCSPEEMSKCPIYNFDDDGDICVPEICDEYEEEDDED